MDDEKKISPELQKALDDLTVNLEGKTKIEAKALIDAFAKEYEGKMDKKLTDEIKKATDLLDTKIEGFETKLEEKHPGHSVACWNPMEITR